MNYKSIKNLSDAAFRRSVDMTREAFYELVEVLAQAEAAKKKSGRPSLSLENQLCLTLSDWCEYRTLFHLGLSYGGVMGYMNLMLNGSYEDRLAASGVLDLAKLSTSTEAIAPEAVSDFRSCRYPRCE